jgi:hypothetical protein
MGSSQNGLNDIIHQLGRHSSILSLHKFGMQIVIIGSWFIFPIWVPFPFPFQWYPSDLFCLFLAPFTLHNRWVFLGISNTTIVQISHAHFVESICRLCKSWKPFHYGTCWLQAIVPVQNFGFALSRLLKLLCMHLRDHNGLYLACCNGFACMWPFLPTLTPITQGRMEGSCGIYQTSLG